MYRTVSMLDGRPELVDHKTLADAERYARIVASEGDDCTVLQVLHAERAVEDNHQTLEEYYGLIPGRDFPASLCRGAA